MSDELQADIFHMYEYGTASILAFTKMCLNEGDNSNSLPINDFGSPVKLNRDTELTGKHYGRGVYHYINPRWCKTVVVWKELGNLDIELFAVFLRPFYLYREFPQLFFHLVYIHPEGNASAATEHVKDKLDELKLISSDAPKVIVGDFNHGSVDKSRKGFYQYNNCTICLGKTLDKCYY